MQYAVPVLLILAFIAGLAAILTLYSHPACRGVTVIKNHGRFYPACSRP